MSEYIDIRDNEGNLLFKLDPNRHLIEIVRRGKTTVIDLRKLLVYNKKEECACKANAPK